MAPFGLYRDIYDFRSQFAQPKQMVSINVLNLK